MLVVGRAVAPRTGIDAQLKNRLATILEEMGVETHDPRKGLEDALCWLKSVTRSKISVVAASWTVNRTPHEFLDRHQTGARFAAMPASIQQEGLRQLRSWAEASFGSLDATSQETHAFVLDIFQSH
jgi:hypothetical protein